MSADGPGRPDTLSSWHSKQALADLLNRDVRTITRMVARGEVEKDDRDPLHPRFRYRGRVAKASKPKTGRTDKERESLRLLLETLQRHEERLAALEGEHEAMREEMAFLRGVQRADALSAGQDGQENERRPRVSWWWRLLRRTDRTD